MHAKKSRLVVSVLPTDQRRNNLAHGERVPEEAGHGKTDTQWANDSDSTDGPPGSLTAGKHGRYARRFAKWLASGRRAGAGFIEILSQ